MLIAIDIIKFCEVNVFPVSPKVVKRFRRVPRPARDDARRVSHVAESVPVLVLGHLADEFGAVGAQASDSVIEECLFLGRLSFRSLSATN